MSIRREIEVTRKGLPRPIDVTFGTNIIPFEFVITDFELPDGATVEAYAIGVSKNLVKQSCELSGNVISFTPKIGLFEEGKNVLQLSATYGGKDLFSFHMPVNCQSTMFYEGARDLEIDPTFLGMVSQMKQDIEALKQAQADMSGLQEQVATNTKDIETLNQTVSEKITSPNIAEVGQVLVVEEVDENGKPTSWKVTDAPTGPGGSSGVYVGSGEMPEGYNVQIDPSGEVEGYYTADEIDAMFGAYVTEIAELIGGDA